MESNRRVEYLRAKAELERIEKRLRRLRLEVDTRASVADTADGATEVVQLRSIEQTYAMELFECAAANDATGLADLLRKGVNANVLDYRGMTPLHVAAEKGNREAVELLLAAGAEPSALDRNGRTVFDVAHPTVVDVFTTWKSPSKPASHRRTRSSVVQPQPPSPSCGQGEGLKVKQSVDYLGLVLVMVGLPARGKSYVSRKVLQYFTWNGVPGRVFSFRTYRRDVCQIEGAHERVPVTDMDEVISQRLCSDVSCFLQETQGIAIIDGTFSTRQRRTTISDFLLSVCHIESNNVIFLELEQNSETVVLQNIEHARRAAKAAGENVPDDFVDKYLELIKAHEKVYVKLNSADDATTSFIRLVDYETLELNQIEGSVPSRLVYLLSSLRRLPQPIYLTCAGESEDDVKGLLGGNSVLTKDGLRFSYALAKYMAEEMAAVGEKGLLVMRSPKARAGQTAEWIFRYQRGTHVVELPNLTDLMYGDCDGLAPAEVRDSLPKTFQLLTADPYNTAWPNGESLRQLYVSRLEPLIHEILSRDVPVLVISHRPIVQGLLSYFNEAEPTEPSKAHELEVPLHTVFKVAATDSVNKVERVKLTLPSDDAILLPPPVLQPPAQDDDSIDLET